MLSFILQHHPNFRAVLAKIQAIKQVNRYFLQPFTSFKLSVFKHTTCILHHFAFLVWLPARNFSSAITHFQALKSHFLTTISPFSSMYFMVLRGYVYTIAADFYAFRLVFSTILHCIQYHFALHLASKRTAFCTKMPCVLHQNALHLAAYCTIFCQKQPQIWC